MSGQRANNRIPCALLKDNMCSVYDARPGACRGFTSVSVSDCQTGFNGGPVYQHAAVWTSLRSAHKQALRRAMSAVGLPAEQYEFHHALRIALEIPDAENLWLQDNDISAGVAREIDAMKSD
jgi:Fe-S-cluster containining protein